MDVHALLDWYHAHRRDLPWRRTRDVYAIWVSEVMLQQTQVGTVIPYYRRFMERFPDVTILALAGLDDVLQLWAGLGYYARARNLHRAARTVMAEHGGRIPVEPAEFGRLPGVGDYILAAVMSIAAGHPLPVVDGNVLRVCARLWGITAEIGSPATRRGIRRELERFIPAGDPGGFNQAVMELGAMVCTPSGPRCPACPLQPSCFAFRHGQTAELPFKRQKPKAPEFRYAALVLRRAGRVLIRRRPEEGLLGGLWEFPRWRAADGEDEAEVLARQCRAELSLIPRNLVKLGAIRHTYTHFRMMAVVYRSAEPADPGPLPEDARWVEEGELCEYPQSTADRKMWRLAEKNGR